MKSFVHLGFLLIAVFCLSRNNKSTLFAYRRSLVSMQHGIIKQMQTKKNFIKLIIIAVAAIGFFLEWYQKEDKVFLIKFLVTLAFQKNTLICASHILCGFLAMQWPQLHFVFSVSMATHLFVSSHTKTLFFLLKFLAEYYTKQQQSTTITTAIIIIYSHFFSIFNMRNYTHMFSLSLLRFVCYTFRCLSLLPNDIIQKAIGNMLFRTEC